MCWARRWPPTRLPTEAGPLVSIHAGDPNALAPADLSGLVSRRDVLLNRAGHVTEGGGFVSLVDRVVTGVELLRAGAGRLVCGWGGAARHRRIGSPRRRTAEGEADLLAAPRQLRAPRPVAARLAPPLHDVQDPGLRRAVITIPTAFTIDPAQVQRLIAAGREAARRSPAFQHLLGSLAGETVGNHESAAAEATGRAYHDHERVP
jgi:hypothetical protein